MKIEGMSLEKLLDELRINIRIHETNNSDTSQKKADDCENQILSRFAALTEKVKELEVWKESALFIESQWDKQKVAKLLSIGLGEDIVANIEPKIVALRAENAALKSQVDKFKTMSAVEMMCENENVKNHIEEWEKRCLEAEEKACCPECEIFDVCQMKE